MRPEASLALLLLLMVGCASRKLPETRPFVGGGSEVEINRVIEAAIEADGRAEPADSLYAPYATVIADGRLRRGPPRFAGVAEEGEIAITNTQVQTQGATAWGDVEYRWVSARSNRAQMARASIVLTPAQRRPGWWIVQAHSSVAK
jgi:hypothetical protein